MMDAGGQESSKAPQDDSIGLKALATNCSQSISPRVLFYEADFSSTARMWVSTS